MNTFWTVTDVDVYGGLDFLRSGDPFPVTINHLNHDEFLYKIVVRNTNIEPVKGTVRIFLGAKLDKNYNSLPFDEQKRHMFQMDKFLHICNVFLIFF